MKPTYLPLLLVVLLFHSFLNAQSNEGYEFGTSTYAEQTLKSYDKDPEAPAVVLFEKNKNYVRLVNNNLRFIEEVYVKIKVFDAKKFNQAEIEIPYYTPKGTKDKISKLKAVTHNGNVKNYLSEANIYTKKLSEYYSSKSFTFPNIQDGSVLEYYYTLESTYFSTFDGWVFQDELPKVHSELVTEIPGNFVYSKSLIGNLKLHESKNYLKEDCFYISGIGTADCEGNRFVMKDVPAFKEEEFMLAPTNYKAKINYEIKQYTNFSGLLTNYTKTWKNVDKEFRTDKDMGRQIKHTGYFKSVLPPNLLTISDPFEKAKAIYYHMQDHFSWNGKYRIFNDVRVKDAYDKKSGNNTEINLSLINALKAADLDAKIMLISTRQNGLPSQLYPVLNDFNFAIVHLTINDNIYLLDATDKYTPFGLLPYRDLNLKGRVMDFKEGSYWFSIVPYTKNVTSLTTMATLNSDGVITGQVQEKHTGYMAMIKRNELSTQNENEYLDSKNSKGGNLYLSQLEIQNKKELDAPLIESYEINFEPDEAANEYLINPFFVGSHFTENPFKLNGATYPINFGFGRVYAYNLSLKIDNSLNISSLPQNISIKLPEGGGDCKVLYNYSNGTLTVRFALRLTKDMYPAEAYETFKDFFGKVSNIQVNRPIIVQTAQ